MIVYAILQDGRCCNHHFEVGAVYLEDTLSQVFFLFRTM